MKPRIPSSAINRRALLSTLAVLPAFRNDSLPPPRRQRPRTAGGVLPSWNDGPAKQAIVDFVRATTDQASPKFVPPDERVAEFDQDGTLWVEHPMYTQFMFCLDRVGAVVKRSRR